MEMVLPMNTGAEAVETAIKACRRWGYTRKGIGTVVGPMPPMGSIIKDSDDLWKMITFIRSRFDGDPAYKYGVSASQQ